MPDMNGKGGVGHRGRETAYAFARYGAYVAVVDLDKLGGVATEEHINSIGGEAIFIEVDVSQEMQVKDMVDQTLAAFGRLDYTHDNAGIDGEQALLADQTTENWNRVIAVNLSGVFFGMKYEIPAMLKRGKGAIVNTASVAGLKGFGNIAPYVASKHGVAGFTKSAVADYGTSGIRFNALCHRGDQHPDGCRFLEGESRAHRRCRRQYADGQDGRAICDGRSGRLALLG